MDNDIPYVPKELLESLELSYPLKAFLQCNSVEEFNYYKGVQTVIELLRYYHVNTSGSSTHVFTQVSQD